VAHLLVEQQKDKILVLREPSRVLHEEVSGVIDTKTGHHSKARPE
jgi:hypothetical protein